MTGAAEVARLVCRCLERGAAVDIDGLGVFRRDQGRIAFTPHRRTRVFLAYVIEDAALVDRLHDDLAGRGFDPWLDRRKLLPGQNWPRRIDQAITLSDFFVACFSRRAVVKRGRFQAELRYALDCATHVPLDQSFIVPVRLEACAVPNRIAQSLQYVDLFPDWAVGVDRLAAAMCSRP